MTSELEQFKPASALQDAWNIYRGLSENESRLPFDVDMTSEDQYCKAKVIMSLFQGRTIAQAASEVGLSSVMVHLMMKRDDTFRAAVELEREMRLSDSADQLERDVWRRALDGERKDSMILSMYALKSKRDEYKDNHQGQSDNRVVVNIEIDGKKFDAEFTPNE